MGCLHAHACGAHAMCAWPELVSMSVSIFAPSTAARVVFLRNLQRPHQLESGVSGGTSCVSGVRVPMHAHERNRAAPATPSHQSSSPLHNRSNQTAQSTRRQPPALASAPTQPGLREAPPSAMCSAFAVRHLVLRVTRGEQHTATTDTPDWRRWRAWAASRRALHTPVVKPAATPARRGRC